MKRLLAIVLFLVLMFASSGSNVHAYVASNSQLLKSNVHHAARQKHIPFTSCSGVFCSARQIWNGEVEGSSLYVTISNPSLNCANGDVFARYVEYDPQSSTDAFVYFGYGNCMQRNWGGVLSYNPGCGGNAGRVFFEVVTPTNSLLSAGCSNAISSNDVGNALIMDFDSENISGTSVLSPVAIGAISHTSYCGGCGYTICSGNCSPSGFYMTFSDIVYNELFLESDGSLTDHEVWGSEWINNEWRSPVNNNLGYQTNDGTPLGGPQANNPIQMYWKTKPAPGNNGGTLYSCVYPGPGTTCTLGS